MVADAVPLGPPHAAGDVDDGDQASRPAGREREHGTAAERLADCDHTREVRILAIGPRLERAGEIIGLEVEAAHEIAVLASHVERAARHAGETIRPAVAAPDHDDSEPSAGRDV